MFYSFLLLSSHIVTTTLRYCICDQGHSSTKWNSHATIMWLALTPGLGVDHYELPLKANFILYINSLNWATQ